MIEYFVTVYGNGDVNWCDKDHCLHREDGPAVELNNGEKRWYKHGLLHKEDGPAVEMLPYYKAWFKDGKRHRLDGPAEEWESGLKKWHVGGNSYSEKEYLKLVKINFPKIVVIDGKKYKLEEVK